MKPYVTIALKNISGVVLTYVTSTNNSNVSNPSQAVQKKDKSDLKGFQFSLASSVLDGSHTFFPDNGYPGYLSSSTQNASITIKAVGDTISNLYITFDPVTGEHAKTIKVNNKTFDNNNVSTFLSFNAATDIVIELSNWSAPNSTIKVSNIAITPTITLLGSDLINFKCSENLLDSDLQIDPGICEQYADLEIYDRGNIFHQLALEGLLNDDCDVNINTDDFALGIYISSEWNVEIDNSIISLSCRDRSYLFEKILIQRADIAERSIDDLLNILFSQANIPWNYLDNETQTRCQSIVIPNNWFAQSNLKTLLEKICSLGMLRMYWSLNTFYVGRAV